ncbi:MAG: prepilin-type N-terminal cleavage/methylation domain-containing protein [Desulfobacteraceae bacterium]|nr:prepilin-type N-terminal cleavage/methylation domain-containing protein [Desulfobacteraceae bacterium]
MKIVSNKGFTFLEVMISVSIIALVFVSLFRMQSGTIRLATAGKFNTIAPILAKQLLVTVEQDIENWSETKGEFSEHYSGMEWTCEVSDVFFENLDFISEDNQKRFKKIDIHIVQPSESNSYEISAWRFLDE